MATQGIHRRTFSVDTRSHRELRVRVSRGHMHRGGTSLELKLVVTQAIEVAPVVSGARLLVLVMGLSSNARGTRALLSDG